jgi:hypothetical protein
MIWVFLLVAEPELPGKVDLSNQCAVVMSGVISVFSTISSGSKNITGKLVFSVKGRIYKTRLVDHITYLFQTFEFCRIR